MYREEGEKVRKKGRREKGVEREEGEKTRRKVIERGGRERKKERMT